MLQIEVEVPTSATVGSVLAVPIPNQEQSVKIQVPQGCVAGDRLCLSSSDKKNWSVSMAHLVHARLCDVNQLQEENDALDDDIKRLEAEIDEAKAELQALPAQSDGVTSPKKVQSTDRIDVRLKRSLRGRENDLALKEAEAAASQHELLRLQGVIGLRDEELAELKQGIQANREEAKQICARLNSEHELYSIQGEPVSFKSLRVFSFAEIRGQEADGDPSKQETGAGPILEQSHMLPSCRSDSSHLSMQGQPTTPRWRLKWEVQPTSISSSKPNSTFGYYSPRAPLPQARSCSAGATAFRLNQQVPAPLRGPSPARLEVPKAVCTPWAWGTSTLRNMPLLLSNVKAPLLT